MSKKNDEQPVSESAWKKDKEIGNILQQTFDPSGDGTTFLLIAGRIADGKQATKYGEVERATMLVRKVDDDHRPYGPVIEVSTVESAIVAKVAALQDDDVPAIVRYHTVASKQRDGDPAKVLTYVGKPGDTDVDLFDKYAVAADSTTDDMAGFGQR